jgi:hypothetical protein
VSDSGGTLCSIEDEIGNVRQIPSPEIRNRMGKLVMDTSGNVYFPDEKSNCVYTLSTYILLSCPISI